MNKNLQSSVDRNV